MATVNNEQPLQHNLFQKAYLQRWLNRRTKRPCDACRARKTRCDGISMLETQCSICRSNQALCTYKESKMRPPARTKVELLESRLELLESYLGKACPSIDFMDLLRGKYDHLLETIEDDTSGIPYPTEPEDIQSSEYSLATRSLRSVGNEADVTTSENLDGEATNPINPSILEELPMSGFPYADIPCSIKKAWQNQFFGEASEMLWIHSTITKAERLGSGSRSPSFRYRFWTTPKVSVSRLGRFPPQNYRFPSSGVLSQLIDIYFEHINTIFPMFHKPTFLKHVSCGLHVEDETFGAVLLLVCACAAPLCDDPEVFLLDVDSLYTRGWKYFAQVIPLLLTTHLRPTHLHLLQIHALVSMFLKGSTIGHACWTLLGIGLSIAQSIGAHRRPLDAKPTVESELLKRAFWVLVCMDRMLSQLLGRPIAMRDEDFDADLPIECDDEYWEHPDPEQRFRQPPNKPTTVTCFIHFLRLIKIAGFALRTIYPTNHSKIARGITQQKWQEHFVVELDSAVHRWFHSLPEFLQWDPNANVDVFYTQAAMLRTYYYYTQILIHRQFISSPHEAPILPFPSLSICANAAKACISVIETHYRRVGIANLPLCLPTSVAASLILIQSILLRKMAGEKLDMEAEMRPLNVALTTLQEYEERLESSGRASNILLELSNLSGLHATSSPDATVGCGNVDCIPPNAAERVPPCSPSEASILPEEVVWLRNLLDDTGPNLGEQLQVSHNSTENLSRDSNNSEDHQHPSASMTPFQELFHGGPSPYHDYWGIEELNNTSILNGLPVNLNTEMLGTFWLGDGLPARFAAEISDDSQQFYSPPLVSDTGRSEDLLSSFDPGPARPPSET